MNIKAEWDTFMNDERLNWPLYILALLYRFIRGPSETTLKTISENYHERCYYKICDNNVNKEDIPRLLIWSRRQDYLVKYYRWYMINRTYVSYIVDIRVASTDGKVQHLPRKYFPAMAWGISNKDRYPHNVAINAALHDIMKTIKEVDNCNWIELENDLEIVRETHL